MSSVDPAGGRLDDDRPDEPSRRRRGRRRRRLLPLAIVVLGLAVFGSAILQPVKGAVGERMLERTLHDRMAASPADRANPDLWRPWPWADLAPVAELYFPGLGESRVVIDSASGEALAWGAGHMQETAGLASPGVSVIAGHRDGAFELLGQVNEGDVVELTTVDGELVRYLIDERVVVDSGRAQLPVSHEGTDELILTTCWPIDALVSGPERLVLRATPVA